MEYCNPKHGAGCAGGAHAALPSRRAVSSLSELAQGKFNDDAAEDGVTSLSAALRSSKMVPRVHMRPIHVLAVMLILVTALCASLTMLISQSLTYQKVQNEQASVWPTDVHNTAAGQHGAETSNSNGRSAKHKQKSGHKNSRESDAESAAETAAESGVENTTIQPVNDDGVYDDTVSQQNSNSAPVTSTRTTKSSRTQRKSQAAAAPSAKATASQRTRARTSSGNSGNNGNSDPINLNTATANQIETIKGIGPKTAARIIKQRNAMGRFTRLEDLLRIKGIGPKTLRRLSGIVEIR
ncbi:ComEA family DNA-binding protein [Gardnerella sp. KA00747]|uniref:ComEA family DNA-binding protein n=1 Tax=Gardnerella sp. KA00747 TaxID=2749078 RepID=UPI003BAC435D